MYIPMYICTYFVHTYIIYCACIPYLAKIEIRVHRVELAGACRELGVNNTQVGISVERAGAEIEVCM